MTIPTRGELIERACRMPTERHYPLPGDVADFCLAEIRRAVAEELEALREDLAVIITPFDSCPSSHTVGFNRAVGEITGQITARLAALRQTEQPPGAATVAEPRTDRAKTCDGAAGSTPAPGATYTGTKAGLSVEVPHGAGASERTRLRDESPAGNVAAPALSDAHVLERADRHGRLMRENHDKPEWYWYHKGCHEALNEVALELRAASAPKPVDVFEAFDREWHAWDRGGEPLPLCGLARDWFGPLVAALEKARQALGSTDTAVHDAGIDEIDDALSALRQRAQEASR